ncbi:Putative carboxylesterase, type B, carboxylesterase type B, alpha/Beta hydrolase [Colletotrichum destructivum]|uniref:Carboxylesterase, type B, carboxylesterase type B, alpha/Beta hydrolase n=1 Tax=Colletotrichum destructivum TaxID=34406 RepID=A0AAX4I711_9PEZI|nr:Putative carboxylesterase, type B, carboxylesterase type B, alpha/Beta hydrolase [Colletotrichum destructivum]
MKLSHSSLLIAVSAAVAQTTTPGPTATSGSSTLPSVTLDYCTVVATAGNDSVGYYKYQNIRFAAVPTGDLRWAKPQPPPVETEINTGGLASADVACSSNEDCLYVDVWTPANAEGKNLPVMVWTYGGGFTGGSKSENTPEGLFDLSTDFVFVAYNYRLGMTGLANGPTFLHEGGTSNTAIWDVSAAFEWTKKYIGSFGGDPDQITAVGFSAGASQTLFQMTRFAGHAEQLYHRAYVMSPGFVPGAGHQHAEAFWLNVSSEAGCPGGSLECMRGIDFDTLNTAATTIVDTYDYQFQPRVDGDIIADTYEAQLYQGRFNFTGPVVATHEQHEANGQAYTGVNTTEDVAAYLRIFFPAIEDSVVDEILALYHEDDYTSPGLRFSDMKQHFDLTAHNLALTHAMDNQTWNGMVALDSATHGTDQSYYWYSTYSLSSSSSSDSTGSATSNTTASNSTTTSTAASSSSSSSAGGPPSGGGGGPGGSSSVNATIAIMMQKYLLSFVLTGNPNTLWPEDKLEWPQYNSSTAGTQIVFNTTFYLDNDDLANDQAKFWNKALWY